MFGGIQIISNPLLTVAAEDWSQVRSKGRATRRRKQGHPQRIRFYQKPDTRLYLVDGYVIGHPVTVTALNAALLTPPVEKSALGASQKETGCE